jgi:hypothetical protein
MIIGHIVSSTGNTISILPLCHSWPFCVLSDVPFRVITHDMHCHCSPETRWFFCWTWTVCLYVRELLLIIYFLWLLFKIFVSFNSNGILLITSIVPNTYWEHSKNLLQHIRPGKIMISVQVTSKYRWWWKRLHQILKDECVLSLEEIYKKKYYLWKDCFLEFKLHEWGW